MITCRRFRRGFTLVELLVVIGIMLVLATVAVIYLPSSFNSQREARAAQSLQGALLIARQRAVRDRIPFGLRLNIKQTSIGGTVINNIVTDCQYIAQPDDYNVGNIQSGPPNPPASGFGSLNTIGFNLPNAGDLLNGNLPYNVAEKDFWAVQPGDYLEIFGTGLMYTIVSVGVPNSTGTVQPNFIAIDPPMPNPITTPTNNYRIVRAPRTVDFETVRLPDGTVIDLNTNALFGNPLPLKEGYFDILFSPNGSVITPGLSTANIHLWVRAPSEDAVLTSAAYYPPNNKGLPEGLVIGSPTIISVSVRSGLVSAYSPGPSTAPYANVQ